MLLSWHPSGLACWLSPKCAALEGNVHVYARISTRWDTVETEGEEIDQMQKLKKLTAVPEGCPESSSEAGIHTRARREARPRGPQLCNGERAWEPGSVTYSSTRRVTDGGSNSCWELKLCQPRRGFLPGLLPLTRTQQIPRPAQGGKPSPALASGV